MRQQLYLVNFGRLYKMPTLVIIIYPLCICVVFFFRESSYSDKLTIVTSM